MNLSSEEAKTDLEQNYGTPGHPVAFSGVNYIYKHYNKKLPIKTIKDIIYKNVSYSRHKETHRQTRNPFMIFRKRHQFQIDLVDISKFSNFNDGFKYLFTCIDVFTKKAFVRALKSKKADELIIAFQDILNEAVQKPKTILADKGTEFKNIKFKQLCNENNIKLIFAENEVHGAIVERFNRTLQVICYKYMTQIDSPRYIPELQNLLKTYNSRYHRSIKMPPNEAEKPENQNKLFELRHMTISKLTKKYRNKKHKFKIGDTVRIKRWKFTFGRSYDEQFSEEIFKITEIHTRKPIVTYTIQDLRGETIQGVWYENELSLTTPGELFKIEKIIRYRGKGSRRQAYIKWRGYGNQFNSWINVSEIPN